MSNSGSSSSLTNSAMSRSYLAHAALASAVFASAVFASTGTCLTLAASERAGDREGGGHRLAVEFLAPRDRPGGQLRDHGFRRSVHEHVLAVDPAGIEERRGRIAHPPAVPVMTQGRVPVRAVTVCERLPAVGRAAECVVDPPRGH